MQVTHQNSATPSGSDNSGSEVPHLFSQSLENVPAQSSEPKGFDPVDLAQSAPVYSQVEGSTPQDPLPEFSFSTHVEQAIVDKSREYNLNPNVLATIVFIESSGKEHAKNASGAKGLMQLKEETFEAHMPHGNIYDPHDNIEAALREMQNVTFPILQERYGIDPSTLSGLEIYILHQQGRAGGPPILAANRGQTIENVPLPNGTFRDITPGSPVPEIVAAGVSLERQGWKEPETPGEAAVRLERNMPFENINVWTLTATDFMNLWAERMGPLRS
jgi:hypothetical protein